MALTEIRNASDDDDSENETQRRSLFLRKGAVHERNVSFLRAAFRDKQRPNTYVRDRRDLGAQD
jgi:hypothetical protein